MNQKETVQLREDLKKMLKVFEKKNKEKQRLQEQLEEDLVWVTQCYNTVHFTSVKTQIGILREKIKKALELLYTL